MSKRTFIKWRLPLLFVVAGQAWLVLDASEAELTQDFEPMPSILGQVEALDELISTATEESHTEPLEAGAIIIGGPSSELAEAPEHPSPILDVVEPQHTTDVAKVAGHESTHEPIEHVIAEHDVEAQIAAAERSVAEHSVAGHGAAIASEEVPATDLAHDEAVHNVADSSAADHPTAEHGTVSPHVVVGGHDTVGSRAVAAPPRAEGRNDLVWASMSLYEQAEFYYEEGRFSLAERAYIEIIEYSKLDSEVFHSLCQLSELYYASGKYTKAIDMLEQCILKFPDLAANPERFFRLGEFYRDAGLPTRAAELFFRVINSIVVGGDKNLKRYLQLARLAKFEIARSHYLNRDYERALSLFDRIELLELSPGDHETVVYYKILSTLKTSRPKAGLLLMDEFLGTFPESEFVPELLYMKADVLMDLGEVDASIAVFMSLLESTGGEQSAGASSRVFWHQQAGNRLANRFYTEGDYLVALRIYQGMVELSELPSWRMPVVYQIALCFEKLKMPERAKESYLFMQQNLKKIESAAISPALRQLQENVTWRLKVMDWRQETEQQASGLINKGENT